jgi:hypothetical protein
MKSAGVILRPVFDEKFMFEKIPGQPDMLYK